MGRHRVLRRFQQHGRGRKCDLLIYNRLQPFEEESFRAAPCVRSVWLDEFGSRCLLNVEKSQPFSEYATATGVCSPHTRLLAPHPKLITHHSDVEGKVPVSTHFFTSRVTRSCTTLTRQYSQRPWHVPTTLFEILHLSISSRKFCFTPEGDVQMKVAVRTVRGGSDSK